MKFYEPDIRYEDGYGDVQYMREEQSGNWATRGDAEQAAKDAVAMARIVQAHIANKAGDYFIAGTAYLHINSMEELYTLVIEQNEVWKQAQAIIEKYEGAKG